MKRIEAFLKKKVENAKVNIRLKKIETALQSATNNAEDKKVDAELELQHIMESIADEVNLTECIERISDAFDRIEESELILKRIKKIKQQLEEEVQEQESK